MAVQGERLAAEERAFLSAGMPDAPLSDGPAASPPAPPKRLARPAALLPAPPAIAQILTRHGRTLGAAIETEAARGGKFLLAPVAICIGAIAYFALPFEPDTLALACAMSLTAAAAWIARRHAAFWALIALLLVCAGMGAAKLETWRAGTKMIGGEITTRITGRVAAIEHRPHDRVRLTLDVLATERPALRYQPDRVRLTARGIPEETRAGSVVVGVARLLPPLGPLRPGSYDFAFESYFDGIGANGFFFRDPVLLATAASPSLGARFDAFVENARVRLAERIRGHIGGAEGEIAAALVTGVRAGIPEEANESLRITGLAHVLSISGLHMALVAGVFIGALRGGFALFPDFASRHPVRKYAAAAAIVAVSLYLFLSGAEVAAQRSYLMIAVMLVALLFDRAALTMRNLAIAAIAILAVAPHEAAGPSFQMSFAATAALIAAYAWWAERAANAQSSAVPHRSATWRILRKALLYAFGLAATSVIAGAATGIFGAWHFQRIAPLGLIANLATMPIVSVLVMPFAMIGMALMPLDLDGWIFPIVGKGLEWMLDVSDWLAARSPLDEVGEIPVAAVAVLTLALVPLAVATTAPVRWLAAPLLVAGILMIAHRDLPQMFVSEDGRLVALRLEDGVMSINRIRPRAFTVEDWRRAMMAESVARPEKADTLQALLARFSEDAAAAHERSGRTLPPSAAEPTSFVCAEDLCLGRAERGAIVAHAASMPAALPACGLAALIVITDATAGNPCPHTETVVLTGRHLALRGSADVTFDANLRPQVHHAIGAELRPWHDHRRYSREARGLPPWQPPQRATTTAAGQPRAAEEPTANAATFEEAQASPSDTAPDRPLAD